MWPPWIAWGMKALIKESSHWKWEVCSLPDDISGAWESLKKVYNLSYDSVESWKPLTFRWILLFVFLISLISFCFVILSIYNSLFIFFYLFICDILSSISLSFILWLLVVVLEKGSNSWCLFRCISLLVCLFTLYFYLFNFFYIFILFLSFFMF